MVKAKITDNKELERLVRETDMTVEQIGNYFGVHKSTASVRIKKLGIMVRGDGTLRTAQEVNDRKLKLVKRLDASTKRLESEVKFATKEMKACDERMGQAVTEAEKETIKRDRWKWQGQVVKLSAEIRQELGLLRELKQADYEIAQVEKFKELVLQEIGNASQEIRDRILKGLNQHGSDSGIDKLSRQEVPGRVN